MPKAITIVGKPKVLYVRIEMTDEEASQLDHFLFEHTREIKDVPALRASVPFMLHCALQSRHHTENTQQEADYE